MKTVLLALVTSFFLVGCTTIQITPPTHSQQVVLVKNAAKVASMLALKEVWPEPTERTRVAKEMTEFAQKVQVGLLEQVSLLTIDSFVEHFFSGENCVYIEAAIDTLSQFVSFQTPKLNEEQQDLVRAFFLGVEEGCAIYLDHPVVQ